MRVDAHDARVASVDKRSASTDLSALFEAQQILGGVLASARNGRANPIELERVYAAARCVFGQIHDALDQFGEGRSLTREQRRDVFEGLEQARRAVEEVARTTDAKRIQIEATNGEPLTICFGRRARRIPEIALFTPADSSWARDVAYSSFGVGCGLVFRDSLARFSKYCPECQRKPGKDLRRKL